MGRLIHGTTTGWVIKSITPFLRSWCSVASRGIVGCFIRSCFALGVCEICWDFWSLDVVRLFCSLNLVIIVWHKTWQILYFLECWHFCLLMFLTSPTTFEYLNYFCIFYKIVRRSQYWKIIQRTYHMFRFKNIERATPFPTFFCWRRIVWRFKLNNKFLSLLTTFTKSSKKPQR